MRNSEANKWIAREMLLTMPEKKVEQFVKALRIQFHLTSSTDFTWTTITVYKEGWYLESTGCRCSFALWMRDKDGEIVFEGRKPNENKLHRLYGEYIDNISDLIDSETWNEWSEKF